MPAKTPAESQAEQEGDSTKRTRKNQERAYKRGHGSTALPKPKPPPR